MVKRCQPKAFGKVARPTLKAKKSRFENSEGDSDATEENIFYFEDVNLEDFRLNPFDVVPRIATFGTKLLEADRKFAEGGIILRLFSFP